MAIAEAELTVGKSTEGAGGDIVNIDADEGISDFLAVGADVLDGGGASEAGDFGEGFDAGEALIYGVFYDIIPVFAAHDFEANR